MTAPLTPTVTMLMDPTSVRARQVSWLMDPKPRVFPTPAMVVKLSNFASYKIYF